MDTITPELWHRIQELFEEVLPMNTSVRKAHLESHCPDERLRRLVDSLVYSSEQSGNLLDEVIAEEAAAMTGLAAGERIGHYEIVRELGQGGMGIVYLAVRADDEYRKNVAIKLMRADFLNRSAVTRFRTERQILATLEHPGIARLIDGGATVQGAPYVVMEYVDGIPLDRFCNDNQLSVRDRLNLFLKIAEAVSYAHRNLVVHRDIKPENVLVTGSGEPKLLDFGIARLLVPEGGAVMSAETAVMTVAAERLMTPEYASPEQARGEAITTLSDVYSLGATLYKLLTGQSPVRFNSLRAADIEREICNTTPMRPSLAARPAGIWGKLGKDGARDLDTILMVALNKEQTRRYATVENFAADIQRFLNGFAVEARGDSWSYRTGKLIRRHPLATGALALFLATVVLFSAGMAVLARKAREEARTANEVTDFLLNVFQSNDPAVGRGDLVTARELLDRGAKQLDTRLQNDPVVQTRLFDTMGALYNALGSSQKAEEMLRRSFEVRRTRLSPSNDEAAGTLDSLGDVALDLSHYPEAENYYRQALAIHLERDGSKADTVARDQASIASALWDMGRFQEAEALDRRAIELETTLTGEDDPVLLGMKNDLGTVLVDEGRYREASQQQREVLDRRIRSLPPNHPDLGYSWHNYAQALVALGDFKGTEIAERKAMAVRVAAYGENHPMVAMNRGELASILVITGQYEEALPMARQGFVQELKILGPNNRDTSYTQANYGRALLAVGDGSGALREAEGVLVARQHLFPAGHEKIAECLQLLGSINLALGNLTVAETDLRKSAQMRAAYYGPKHVKVGDSRIWLAEVLARQGRLDEAEAQAADALAIERSYFADGHPQVGLAESTLGWIELSQGRAAQALPRLRDAFDQVRKAYGQNNPQTAQVGLRLAKALASNGRIAEAQKLAGEQAPALIRSKNPQWGEERLLAVKLQSSNSIALSQSLPAPPASKSQSY